MLSPWAGEISGRLKRAVRPVERKIGAGLLDGHLDYWKRGLQTDILDKIQIANAGIKPEVINPAVERTQTI